MSTWSGIIDDVLRHEAHREVFVKSGVVPHPCEAGFTRHLGLPVGQAEDWRKTVRGGEGIHVRVYREGYGVHWDRVCPLERPLMHGFVDTPIVAGVACVAAVLVVGGVAVAMDEAG